MLRRTVLAGIAASAAASRAMAQADDWKKVEEAGRKEGKLVIYTASIGSPFLKATCDAFEKKYGITVERFEARASEVRERVRVEQSAGRFLGDIHHNGSTTTWLMERDGNFQPRGDIPNAKNIVAPYAADAIKIPCEVISYCLMVNRGHVLTTETIIEKVWGYTGEGDRNLLKSLISRLRAKVEPSPREPKLITTVPGVGYTFNPPEPP